MEAGSKGQSTERPLPPTTHRISSTTGGLLSRLPFIKMSSSSSKMYDYNNDDPPAPAPGSRTIATAIQQQHKTRRRRGSLRKVALLGRGAQRDRRDSSPLTVDTSTATPSGPESADTTPKAMNQYDALGLNAADLTPRPPTDAHASRTSLANPTASSTSGPPITDARERESSTVYNSTTDEDEMVQLPHSSGSMRPSLPMSSTSGSYFRNIVSTQRRRSFHQVKSPLSYNGLSTTPLQPPDSDWDYSETEWWGWVVLIATWLVFVVGMGSCLGIWSWAWDVGKTPYAPPELEDDPTLPIVGYYPSLMILTCVMAWVWVVVAWVGMKYFRHAKISGD